MPTSLDKDWVGIPYPAPRWRHSARAAVRFFLKFTRVLRQRSALKWLWTGAWTAAHVIGTGTEERINLFAVAIKTGLTAIQIKGLIFAYPGYASDLGSIV